VQDLTRGIFTFRVAAKGGGGNRRGAKRDFCGREFRIIPCYTGPLEEGGGGGLKGEIGASKPSPGKNQRVWAKRGESVRTGDALSRVLTRTKESGETLAWAPSISCPVGCIGPESQSGEVRWGARKTA